jgi:hypothetical protein
MVPTLAMGVTGLGATDWGYFWRRQARCLGFPRFIG